MIYLMLIPMVLISIYSGYQNKIDLKKLSLWFYFFFFLICMSTNILTLRNLLFHAQFIPGNLKNGNYGFVGGASFGGVILNLMVVSFVFGILIRLAKNNNIAIGEEKSNDLKRDHWIFPEWFNRISHAISGCIVGSAFGLFWLSFANHKPIEEYGDLTIGSIIGAAGIYSIAGIIVLFQKMNRRM